MRVRTSRHPPWLLGAPLFLVAAMPGLAGNAAAVGGADQVRDEIFLQVFKHSPPRLPVTTFVLLVLDGAQGRKVPAQWAPGDGSVRIPAPVLLALLRPTLKPECVATLERRTDADGHLGSADLETLGCQVEFDPRTFELRLKTPPSLRGTRISDLGPRPADPFSVDALRPARVSGFVNFHLKGTSQTTLADRRRTEDSGAALALDGAVNVAGVVLEGSAFGQETSGSWRRGDLRLVLDRPRQALRFTAGDLSAPVVGYQVLADMLGVGVARDYALQPHLPTWRTNDFQFQLDRPAEVKVWVNDSLVSTLRLPAGAHDLRGLNAAVGANDVRLEIEDEAGRRDRIEFSFLFNPVLLAAGRNVFSWNAGFRRAPGGDAPRYDFHRPILAGSFLAGWTDHTTAGAYTQVEEERALFGLQVLHAFPAGTLRLDTALARAAPRPWDAAGRLEWTSLPAGRLGLRTQLALEYLGRDFGNAGSALADRSAVSVRASLSAPVGRTATVRLSGSHVPARRRDEDGAHQVSATLTQRWGRHLTGSFTLRHRRAERERSATEALFGLSANLAWKRASFFAAREPETGAVSLRWDSGRSWNVSAPYGYAESRLDGGEREYRAAAGYSGYRGLAEIEHRRLESTGASGSQVLDETTLRVQGAVVFADGVLALARPVVQNFAVITGRQGLRDVVLRVDPDDEGGSRARADRLGPAVVEDLPSYRLRDLRVEPVNPPLGATPDRTSFTLAPAYKSGVLVRLGREPRIVAVGQLVDEEREPLAHRALEITRLGEFGATPVSTFTSRRGMFQLPDARPGRYEIRLAGEDGRVALIEIPARADDLQRLGAVVLSRR